MIEVHIVADDDPSTRLIVGPADVAPAPETDPPSVCTLRVENEGEEVASWVLGPESARMLVEEIRRRACANGRFM